MPSLCSFVRTDSWRYTNFSPDGSRFVATDGRGFNNACIWDIETGELLAVFEEASLAKFYPNGNLVVITDELEVQIWQWVDE